MARRKQDIILENVVIEAVAAEGKALARIDGTVLFVQFAVPGDIVDVKVNPNKPSDFIFDLSKLPYLYLAWIGILMAIYALFIQVYKKFYIKKNKEWL